MSEILCDARAIGSHGIGRFTREVLARLPDHQRLTNGPKPQSALDPIWQSIQILKHRPDLYFSPGYNPPLYCSAPFVFTIHDLIHLQVPEEQSFPKQMYYRHVVLPAARRARCVLTVSCYSRQEIIKWASLREERVVVVGNGVAAAFSPHGHRKNFGFPYILYVGNYKPHKNVDRLLRAFSRLDMPELRLVLSGCSTEEMKHRIESAGVSERVVFGGHVPEGEMPALYRGAELLVLPSTLEGFGLPALEAMASGIPVVAARSSSLPEVIGDAGLLVDPLDETGLLHGMEKVLGSADLPRQLRSLGLARAKQFSWSKVADQVLKALGVAGVKAADQEQAA